MTTNNLNQLISNAAHTLSEADYKLFFKAAFGTEFFIDVSPDGKSAINLLKIDDANNAVVLFCSPKDQRLSKTFAGIAWENALELIVTIKNAHGLIVQSEGEEWISITMKKVKQLIEIHRLVKAA